ncbi:MAG: BamA/TamA family outer membrane protein [Paracoccaceae bacterium]|nr:BamA/TamA family outer membrane protein [Paracoccaceae bacterium]
MLRVCLVVLLACLAPGLATAETRISFQTPGASDDLRDDLRAASLTVATGRNGTAQDLLAAAQADYARLLGVLYQNARYGAVITIRIDGREAAAIPPLNAPGTINTIAIEVRPGPRYRLSTARIGPLAPGTELPEDFRPGAPAGSTTLQDAATAAIDGWRSEGRAKARITDQNIIARHDANRVSATIAVAPGPRLRFGTTTIEGNRNVRTRRIRTIAGLPEGQVFDPDEVDRAANRLRRTGSFSSVTVEEAPDIGPDSTLPMTIGVVEAIPRRFGFGAEYSTTDGVRLSGFWLHRNLLGGAERFRVDGAIAGLGGETGGTDLSFGVRYERPATPRADVDLFTELHWESLDEPDFTSNTTEFTLGFTRYATDTLVVEFGLGYLYSDTTDAAFGRETYQLLTLPLAATLDRRDDALNPREGFYADLELTPFHGMSGTSDGVQTEFDGRAYLSTTNLTFAGRVQLGALFGPSLAESPPFYRFFSGGGGTVRGHGYQSLALDIGGDRSGGRSFLGLSGELRRDITDTIQVVGFADWGYIGAESFPDFTGDSHAGAGFGLRYNTGIGPIRLDLATPVAGESDGSNFYIYVGIGQAF